MVNRELEHRNNRAMQVFCTFFGETACASAWMHSGGKQRFIRIDISHSRDKRLIQQEGFDVALVALQSREKFSEIDRQRIGSGACEEIRQFVKIFEPAELADVVINESAGIELEHSARKLTRRGVPEQFASHSEMHIEDASFEFEIDLLAAPMNMSDGGAGEALGRAPKIAACDAMRGNGSVADGLAEDMGSDRADDRFDFREFRQVAVAILAICRGGCFERFCNMEEISPMAL